MPKKAGLFNWMKGKDFCLGTEVHEAKQIELICNMFETIDPKRKKRAGLLPKYVCSMPFQSMQ